MAANCKRLWPFISRGASIGLKSNLGLGVLEVSIRGITKPTAVQAAVTSRVVFYCMEVLELMSLRFHVGILGVFIFGVETWLFSVPVFSCFVSSQWWRRGME